MERFIPYAKQSKKAKRKSDRARRQSWGEINPVTRKADNKKAYRRTKPSRWYTDDSMRVLLLRA